MSASRSEIDKALYGRQKGARIRVKQDPADRTADGIVFHSQREMNVYLQFASLLRAGTILELERQVPFVIHATDTQGRKIPICKWIADFMITEQGGRKSIYDAKGMRTEIYKLKKKFVEVEYGFRILEV